MNTGIGTGVGLQFIPATAEVSSGTPTGTGEVDFSNADNSGLVAALGI